MTNTEHVGLTALMVEREKLIDEFEQAIKQGKDDPTKTEHGNVGEAAVRSFFEQFLPKKYGVTKGYIITPDCDYAGPLEEFDIIIYDALESPVLSVRRNKEETQSSGKRGIPIEFVKAVIEVKASFDKAMVLKVVDKLTKLDKFKRTPSGERDRQGHLPESFMTTAIFFTTRVKDKKEYLAALSALKGLWQVDPRIPFNGALILRGQNHPDYSAQIRLYDSNLEVDMKMHTPVGAEMPESFKAVQVHLPFETDSWAISFGFGKNQFWEFMIDLIQTLNNIPSPRFSKMTPYGYGITETDDPSLPCFPEAPAAPATTTEPPVVG